MFSPRFAGQPRDRDLNADGTPRARHGLRVLTDAEAMWAFVADCEPETTPDAGPVLEVLDGRAYAFLEPARATTYRDVGARWWCGCGAFASGEQSTCGRCGDTGPHAWSEDCPTTGQGARRARLRRERRARA